MFEQRGQIKSYNFQQEFEHAVNIKWQKISKNSFSTWLEKTTEQGVENRIKIDLLEPEK